VSPRRLLVAWALASITACTLFNPLDRYQSGKDSPADSSAVDVDVVSPAPDGPIDAGPTWHRYSFNFVDQTWSAPVRLEDLWAGPNAPPPRGIATAVELSDFDRLLVFSDDGTYYLQADGAWRPPAPIARAWAPMASVPRSAYHVPYAFARLVDPTAPDREGITFLDEPNAFLFYYTKDDRIGFDQSRPLTPADGGPPASAKSRWAFEVLDLANADPAKRYKNFTAYDDGSFVEFDAAFARTITPLAESFMFKNKANAPDPAVITAAYFDQSKLIAHLVGP
jgi:hypothetical protein